MDNAQKNQYVKKQITNATLHLLQEKELKDLSVCEITDTAQVNRVSFYRNYKDKEDILQQHIYHKLREWQNNFDSKKSDYSDFSDMFESLFHHFMENKDLYLLLYQRGLSDVMLESIKDICGPKSEHSNLQAYFAGFMSYGLFGWINEWFARGMQETPKEMTALWKQYKNK